MENLPTRVAAGEFVLGVDVSKATLSCALQDPGGGFAAAEFPNDIPGIRKALSWASSRAGTACPLCVEPSGGYEQDLCEVSHGRGHRVLLVDGARTHSFHRALNERNKTDRVDARVLCEYARQIPSRAWAPPSAARRLLADLVKSRARLVDERTRMKTWRRSLRAPDAIRDAAADLRRLNDRVSRLDRKIARLLADTAEFAADACLLLSIPGVGPVFAAVVCALGDLRRFGDVRQFCAYAGIVPQRTQSGTSIDRTRVSKRGDRELRMIAFLGGLSASVHNPAVRTYAVGLARRPELCRKQIIAAYGHKLLRIVYGVLTNRKAFDPTHESTKAAADGNGLTQDDGRASGPSLANIRDTTPASVPRPATEATASDVPGGTRNEAVPVAPGGSQTPNGDRDTDPALGKVRDAAHALPPRPGPEAPASDAPGCICDVAVPVVPGLPPMRMKRVRA